MNRYHDQIEELTRGVELPLTPLHPEHLRIIIDTLFEAWTDLLARHSALLAREDEKAINALMETRLLAFLDEKPIWSQIVRAVARGRETISFDGTKLEKRPDLSIFLTRNAAFPLAVECKIIDPPSKTAKLYCDEGIIRFLTGEYAWAAKEAVMIGYVRGDPTIESELAPRLTEAAYESKSGVVALGSPPQSIGRSEHCRKFLYPSRSPPKNRPGPITLWHLWVST